MPFLDTRRWYEIHCPLPSPLVKRPAIFLDRDGVIIDEKHYLRDPEQVELIPGVAAKLAELLRHDLPIVVVTNQSGIGQGFFGWAEYHLVHQRILKLLAIEQPFTAVYANSHAPAETGAEWRKPNPGMFLQAASDLHIDLAASLMVGDKRVDLQAAAQAGVKRLVHVATGHGVNELKSVVDNFPLCECIPSLASLAFSHP